MSRVLSAFLRHAERLSQSAVRSLDGALLGAAIARVADRERLFWVGMRCSCCLPAGFTALASATTPRHVGALP